MIFYHCIYYDFIYYVRYSNLLSGGEILSDTECNFQERDVSGEGFSPITGQIKRMMIEP